MAPKWARGLSWSPAVLILSLGGDHIVPSCQGMIPVASPLVSLLLFPPPRPAWISSKSTLGK